MTWPEHDTRPSSPTNTPSYPTKHNDVKATNFLQKPVRPPIYSLLARTSQRQALIRGDYTLGKKKYLGLCNQHYTSPTSHCAIRSIAHAWKHNAEHLHTWNQARNGEVTHLIHMTDYRMDNCSCSAWRIIFGKTCSTKKRHNEVLNRGSTFNRSTIPANSFSTEGPQRKSCNVVGCHYIIKRDHKPTVTSRQM